MTAPFAVRDMQPEDVAFVADSWLRSYRKSHFTQRAQGSVYVHQRNPELGSDLHAAYWRDHRAVVSALMRHGLVRIACFAQDSDAIWGWVCAERHKSGARALHYVYVKTPYRGFGVARALIKDALGQLGSGDIVTTHATSGGARILRENRWPHVPYPAFVRKEEAA